jgi:NADH:ubiquinone oxidoreductase subunit C
MDNAELTKYILDKFAGRVELSETGKAEPVFLIKADYLLEFCRAINSDPTLGIDFLCNIAAVDTGQNFEIVYSTASVKNKIRLDFKSILGYEEAEIDSVQEIWAGANWYEREVWELFGINIRNHGNLTRFLLPDDWNQGFPMRKNWDAPDFVRLPDL